MVDIGYHLKNHGVTLTVSVWQHNQDIIPTYELEEVWVHITRVPHAYRNYLVFWALGTVIGTTQEVDMYTYRKMGIIRVKVGILDKSQLPLTTDLVFGTEGYHITYTLEDDSFEPVVAPAEDVDHMDQDDFGAGNGGSEDSDRETAAKKMKSDSKIDTSPPQAGHTGPTPMQHFIAVTPLGKNRPYPGFKLIVLMNGTDKLPQIAVTKPKMGFASDLGRKTTEGSVVKAPDHLQQLAVTGIDTPGSNVGVDRPGSRLHAVPPSVLSTCPDSESISIFQMTNICFDDMNKTSLDLFAADLHDHTQRETTALVIKECMSAQLPQTESGQSDATAPTNLRTPSKFNEGNFLSSASRVGSVFVDDKR